MSYPFGQGGIMGKEPKMRKHWPPQTSPRPSGYPAPQGLGRSLTRQLSMECGNVLYSYECRMIAWVMIGILFLGKVTEGRAQELSANPWGLESALRNQWGQEMPQKRIAVIFPEMPEPDDPEAWEDPDSLPPTLFDPTVASDDSSLGPSSIPGGIF